MRDPYEVLGVPRDANAATIKKQYYQKAKQYHPDLNPGDEEAAEKFKELSEAYDILQDEQKRKMYDTYGAAAFENGGMGQGAGGFGFDMDDIFGDLFSDLFGGGFSRSRSYDGPMEGADIRMDLKLTFKEAVFGTKKKIKYKREENCHTCHGSGAAEGSQAVTCPECGGSGQVTRSGPSPFGFGQVINRTTCPKCHGRGTYVENPCPNCHGSGREQVSKTLEVQVPKGVDNGMILPIRGQGHEGTRGGAAGDVLLILHVAPSDFFERDGNDLSYTMPISFAQAALGDKVEVPALKGKETLEIPEGTQTGHVFTLKGKGIEDVRTHRPGDLHIQVQVKTPENMDHKQKKAMMEFAEAMGHSVDPVEKKFKDKVKDLFDWN